MKNLKKELETTAKNVLLTIQKTTTTKENSIGLTVQNKQTNEQKQDS